MRNPLKSIAFIFFSALILGSGYYFMTTGGTLQSSVLLSETGTGVTPQGGTGNSPIVPKSIAAQVIIGQPTQGDLVALGVELQNPSTTDSVSVYGVGFDIVLPDPATGVSVEEGAPVQTYNAFLVEGHRIDLIDNIVYYKGYSGTGGNPLFLKPGEKKTVFTIPLRAATNLNGDAYSVKITIKTGQVVIDPPVAPGATTSTPVYAIDIKDVVLPTTFYPLGHPDVNFDGRVDNLDVQYLFEFWKP
ncbi:MAG: hypothetical protein P1V18_03160 [Candidatus Gracilibacteria bacterium]|nr:hypothetical protein [Candidatus Gracilibacteria bacterium]